MTVNPDKESKLAIAYLLPRNSDAFTMAALSLLSTLLTSGPNSPMYKALIESGLGSNYVPGTGFEDSLRYGIRVRVCVRMFIFFRRESAFAVGLMGVAEEDLSKVESLVLRTLEEAAKTGFPEERIEALLHQVEISQRHVRAVEHELRVKCYRVYSFEHADYVG